MSLKTVTVITDVCVRCGGATGPEVIPGDTIKLWLDQDAVPSFPEWVEATIVTVEPQTTSSTAPKHYKVQYESDDLDGAAAELRDCDISSVTCVGCCAIINDYLDLMAGVNVPHVSLSYHWNDDGTVTLQAHAYSTQIAGNPGVQVTIESYVFKDPSGTVIPADGDPDSRVVDNVADGGYYSVLVTDSEGLTNTEHVWIGPRFRTAIVTFTAGQTSRMVVLNDGEFIVSAMALRVTEGFFIFAAVDNVLHISAAPAADLDVRILIQK